MTAMLLSRFEMVVDAFIDRIILFADYFIVKQHITLSEGLLFTLCLARAAWAQMFGFVIIDSNPSLTGWVWILIFWGMSLAHLVSFFSKDLLFRITVVCGYAIIWCLLGVLVSFTAVASAAVPTFFTLSILSVFIAIRLIREWRLNKVSG